MGWIKLFFYFMVIYFNYSVLSSNILLGVGLIAIEVIIFGKFYGGSGSNRGFFKKDNDKIEKLLNKLIMLEMMKREDKLIDDGEMITRNNIGDIREKTIRNDRPKKSVFSKTHKNVKSIFDSGGFQQTSSSMDAMDTIEEFNDRNEIYEMVDNYYNKGDFRGIIRTFLGLIRLLSYNLIYQMQGNFNPPNKDKCYPYFDRLGMIFNDTYNSNYLADKLPQLKMIELRTERSALVSEDLTPQTMKEYSEFVIDQYFYIKNFDPDLKTDSEEIPQTRQSNSRLKSNSYNSDSSHDMIIKSLRKFLLSFSFLIGLCGGMIMTQINFLPAASQLFITSGSIFLIVSAVSVYISRKI